MTPRIKEQLITALQTVQEITRRAPKRISHSIHSNPELTAILGLTALNTILSAPAIDHALAKTAWSLLDMNYVLHSFPFIKHLNDELLRNVYTFISGSVVMNTLAVTALDWTEKIRNVSAKNRVGIMTYNLALMTLNLFNMAHLLPWNQG